MSRIGKKPIPVPTGVTVTIEPEVVRVAGPRGDLEERKNRAIEVKQEMARILTEQGYILGFEVVPGEPGKAGDRILVKLKYTDSRESVISGLKRISRPGQRTYVDSKSIPKVLGGMGTAIVSTSRGVMTGHDARKQGVGGELVAQIW